jgi:uncharacterized protein (TIGR02001 family)
MKKSTLRLLAAAATLATLPAISFAEDPPAPSVAFNIGGVSDYRYRGISQSRLKPALQGGIDYTNPNGLYVGTWLSSIKWIKDAGGDDSVEWDIYGGYRGSIVEGLSYDVGVLTYQYPNNKLGDIPGFANANTTEVYGALTYGPATLKYSHSVSNLFGFVDSKSSGYLDLSASFDLGSGFSLAPHIGHQSVAHNSAYSYTDYSLTLGKDLGSGFSVSAAVIGTDDKKVNGVPAYYYAPSDKSLQKATLVVGAKYTF